MNYSLITTWDTISWEATIGGRIGGTIELRAYFPYWDCVLFYTEYLLVIYTPGTIPSISVIHRCTPVHAVKLQTEINSAKLQGRSKGKKHMHIRPVEASPHL